MSAKEATKEKPQAAAPAPAAPKAEKPSRFDKVKQTLEGMGFKYMGSQGWENYHQFLHPSGVEVNVDFKDPKKIHISSKKPFDGMAKTFQVVEEPVTVIKKVKKEIPVMEGEYYVAYPGRKTNLDLVKKIVGS